MNKDTGSLFSCYDTENLILMTIRLCTLAAALQLEVIFCFINFLFVHIQKLLPYHTLGAFHNGIPHQVVYSVRTWNLSSFYITFSEVMKGRFFFSCQSVAHWLSARLWFWSNVIQTWGRFWQKRPFVIEALFSISRLQLCCKNCLRCYNAE